MSHQVKKLVKLSSVEGKRFQKLGDIGELIAIELLKKNDFTNICNLNSIKSNFPFADLSAEKGNHKYLISVKIRNKYERTGKLNSRYKLGSKVYEHIESLLQESRWGGYIPAWIAIAIEPKTFDSYFGTIDQLNGNRGINMSNKAITNYMKLTEGSFHSYNFQDFGNVYKV